MAIGRLVSLTLSSLRALQARRCLALAGTALILLSLAAVPLHAYAEDGEAAAGAQHHGAATTGLHHGAAGDHYADSSAEGKATDSSSLCCKTLCGNYYGVAGLVPEVAPAAIEQSASTEANRHLVSLFPLTDPRPPQIRL